MTNNIENKVLRYIDYVDTNKYPVSLQVGLTDRCLNKCHMCDHHKMKNKVNMNANDWIGFLYDAADLESVCYCGGDSIIHKDINMIMAAHIGLGKSFSFITTGYIPESVDMDLLKKAAWVRVSLDAVDDDIYAESRGGIRLPKVMESIKHMISEGVNVEFSITVHELNDKHIGRVLDFVASNHCNASIKPRYGKSFSDYGLEPTIGAWVNIFMNAGLNLSTHLSESEVGTGNARCSAVYYQSYIDAKGDIYPCCMTAGDTLSKSQSEKLGSIYNMAKYFKNRSAFSKKLNSELPHVCKSCPQRFVEINTVVKNHKTGDTTKTFF